MSQNITFQVAPGSDKDYYDAFERMRSEKTFAYEGAAFSPLFSDMSADDIQKHAGIQEVLSQRMRVFQSLSFRFPGKLSVSISRPQQQQQNTTILDTVSVNRPDNTDPVLFAKLIATVQKHLQHITPFDLGNLLGPSAQQHFEAREVALARLEQTASNLMNEMEEARKRREQETQEKEKVLETQYQPKLADLEGLSKKRQEESDKRTADLDARQKALDDRAAKHARRQHYKDIKDKFKSWGESFQVTKGTQHLSRSVYWFTILLLVLFGGLAGFFLFQTITAQDNLVLIPSVVKQFTFTLLFVSTAYFFIRWNNQWFQRHANEEFHLKHLELDIDRASWFVEMAFEWKEQKGEEIPLELIERLTHGLFSQEQGEQGVEPVDSLAHALLGAARFKVKLTDGTELEYDRKGIQQLLRHKEKGKP